MYVLDLFCGAGGCSVGYDRAGFAPVGVDIARQRAYPSPYPFVKLDALLALTTLLQGDPLHCYADRDPIARYYNKVAPQSFYLEDFAFIHASPPCQGYSSARNIHGQIGSHLKLIEPLRELLVQCPQPYVIENVYGAHQALIPEQTVLLCGLSPIFNGQLQVKRHRLFESSVDTPLTPSGCGDHVNNEWYTIFGRQTIQHRSGTSLPASVGKKAMGIDWMNRDELSQAIPPAYTEYIGAQLLARLTARSEVATVYG